jgi:hypothetical protein
MPASGKMLKKRLQKSNREQGIGDENGRLPSKVVAVATMAQCTVCMASIRSTKTNTGIFIINLILIYLLFLI